MGGGGGRFEAGWAAGECRMDDSRGGKRVGMGGESPSRPRMKKR